MAVQPPAGLIYIRSPEYPRGPSHHVKVRQCGAEQARTRHEKRCTLGNSDARAGGAAVAFGPRSVAFQISVRIQLSPGKKPTGKKITGQESSPKQSPKPSLFSITTY